MAQAEGTSKNDGRVGSSVSGASGSRNSSTSSSRNEKDDGRPTSRGISDSKSRTSTSSFGSSGRSGAANSNPSSKTSSASKSSGFSSKDSTAVSVGKALGSLLGGSVGSSIGGALGKSISSTLGLDRVKSPQMATDAVTGKTVKASQDKVASRTPQRDFSGLGGNFGKMANTLAKAGWTNSMIAGYLGNIEQESGGNTKARNKGDASDGTDSVGQGQWNMDRLTNLQKFAGPDIYDTEKQTQFTMHELATTHRHVADKLANAEDNPEAYAAIFGKNYEVSKQIPERQRYARNWANKISELGVPDVEKAFTKVDDFVSSIQNLGKPVGEKPTTQNTDPFGLGTMISSALGIQNPNVGTQKDGTYVDPYVSSVAGREARGESNKGTSKGRTGAGGLIENAKNDKPLGVVNGVVKAIRDPIGFAVDTVLDLGNQTQAMNTPGPEGEGGDYSQREFGLGFLGSFLNGGSGSSGGFAASEKNGSGINTSQSIAQSPVTQVAQPAAAAEVGSTNPLTPLAPAKVDQAVAAPIGPLTPTRKPFQWSTITGSLDQLLGTTYNG